MSRAFLSLGSNLGDRRAYLQAAVEALKRGPQMKLLGVSKVYETAPVLKRFSHPLRMLRMQLEASPHDLDLV